MQTADLWIVQWIKYGQGSVRINVWINVCFTVTDRVRTLVRDRVRVMDMEQTDRRTHLCVELQSLAFLHKRLKRQFQLLQVHFVQRLPTQMHHSAAPTSLAPFTLLHCLSVSLCAMNITSLHTAIQSNNVLASLVPSRLDYSNVWRLVVPTSAQSTSTLICRLV